MNRAFSKIWVVVIATILLFGGILAWQYFQVKRAEIPLSVLVEKIEQEQVKSITIQNHNIKALLKDGKYLYSKKEKELSLAETFLNYGASPEKLKDIEIIIKKEGLLGAWVLPALLFIFPIIVIYGIAFLVFYFLILTGFKILKIEGVPKSKIIVYIFSIFLLSFFLNSAIPIVIKDVSNRFILYFANFLIPFLVVFLLLKYYFVLSGKKLWQFLLYLIALNLIFFILTFVIVTLIQLRFLIAPVL